MPGLFRVPGNTETIRELKAQYDSGEHVEFDEEVKWRRVCTVRFFVRNVVLRIAVVIAYTVHILSLCSGLFVFMSDKSCIESFWATFFFRLFYLAFCQQRFFFFFFTSVTSPLSFRRGCR